MVVLRPGELVHILKLRAGDLDCRRQRRQGLADQLLEEQVARAETEARRLRARLDELD